MRIAFFVIPSVVAILFLGQFLVSALYETGAFGAEDTRFVWYILIGSAVGLMAATWGRLYSSAFYALGDTRTPLAFACIRVILTAGLGILFAFPLRNALTSTLVSLGFRLPLVPQADLALGAVGLTASAGLAGWFEFLMLKNALEKKIGGCALPFAHLFRKWILALSSAAFAFILDLYLGNELRSWIPAFFPKSAYSLLIIIFFGVMYLAFSFLGEKSGRQKEK